MQVRLLAASATRRAALPEVPPQVTPEPAEPKPPLGQPAATAKPARNNAARASSSPPPARKAAPVRDRPAAPAHAQPGTAPKPEPAPSADVRTADDAPPPPLASAPPSVPAAPSAKPASGEPASADRATPAAPSPSRPLTPANFDAAYLNNPPPPYPRVSRRRGEEGRVVLNVQVSGDGSATAVEVAESSGHPRLDDAAREAVRGWRFVPAQRGEAKVESWLKVPVVFRLEG